MFKNTLVSDRLHTGPQAQALARVTLFQGTALDGAVVLWNFN